MTAVKMRIVPEVSASLLSKKEENVKLLYCSVATRIFGATNCQLRNMKIKSPTAAQLLKSPPVNTIAGYPMNNQLLISLA